MAYRPEFISAVEEEQRSTIARLTSELDEARRSVDALECTYQRDCLGLNNEGDPIGGDPPMGWKPRAEKAERERDAALAGAVEVRELEWDGGNTYASAECATGEYIIESGKGAISSPSWWAWLHRTHDDGSVPYFNGASAESMEAAKAAAQADYRARILAALHPSPDALQAVTAAAYAAAAKAIDADGDFVRAIGLSNRIRALAPADALAAQTRRDAQMMAKGMRMVAKVIAKRKDDYINDHGVYDPSTGVTDFPGDGEEWVGEWEELEETILALAAQTEEAANDGQP